MILSLTISLERRSGLLIAFNVFVLYMKIKSDIVGLGLESSCDETSASVVINGRKILSNIIKSQIDLHREYSGVVPEIASRAHLEVINEIIKAALKRKQV